MTLRWPWKVMANSSHPTKMEVTTHFIGQMNHPHGALPMYHADPNFTPEYDQGHSVIVWYDDLYNLAHPKSAEELAADATGSPPPPQRDLNRCAVCGWTLQPDRACGCVRGNCSQRPLPDRFYDPARAKEEYHGALDHDPRVGVAPSQREPT